MPTVVLEDGRTVYQKRTFETPCTNPDCPDPSTPGARVAGQCIPCYKKEWRAERIAQPEPKPRAKEWRSDDLMHEWDFWRGMGYTRRQFAERIGMKWISFERAYWRAVKRGDPRAVLSARERAENAERARAKHGTRARYQKGCKCLECTAANSRYVSQEKKRRAATRVEIHGRMVAVLAAKHGTATTYRNWSCRCVPCTAAGAQAWSEGVARRAAREAAAA